MRLGDGSAVVRMMTGDGEWEESFFCFVTKEGFEGMPVGILSLGGLVV